MPVDRFCVPIVTCQSRLFYSSGKIEDLKGRVIACRDEFGVVWREGDASYRIIMCLYSFDVVEVGLPVFDDAVVAGRNEPIVVM